MNASDIAYIMNLVNEAVARAIATERTRIAAAVRNVTVYSSQAPSADPYNPYGERIFDVQDAEMLRNDIASAIEGGDL